MNFIKQKSATPTLEPSDSEIIKQILSGDTNNYKLLMRRNNQRLYRIARSIVMDDGRAMDVVQEAHIKAYKNLGKFELGSNFSAWISTITRNEALMVLRKHKPEQLLPIDVHELDKARGVTMNDINKPSDQPDSITENKQLRAQLNSQIDALPEVFRTVFVLRAVQQLSIKETAKLLEINENTVKTRLFRAKTMLQERIVEQCGESVYQFGGNHCDLIVANVMERIRTNQI